MNQLEVNDLATWLDDPDRPPPLLLDVRERWEYRTCHIPDSVLVPMADVGQRLAEMDPERETVVICHHGVRSWRVGRYLESRGFTRVHNLVGGVAAWAREVDPAMPTY